MVGRLFRDRRHGVVGAAAGVASIGVHVVRHELLPRCSRSQCVRAALVPESRTSSLSRCRTEASRFRCMGSIARFPGGGSDRPRLYRGAPILIAFFRTELGDLLSAASARSTVAPAFPSSEVDRLLPDPTGASTGVAPRSRLRAFEFAVQPSLRLLRRIGLNRRVDEGTSRALIGVHDETFFGQAASEPMRRGSTSGTGRGSSPGHGGAILAIQSFQTTLLSVRNARAASERDDMA